MALTERGTDTQPKVVLWLPSIGYDGDNADRKHAAFSDMYRWMIEHKPEGVDTSELEAAVDRL